jgi:hypothetical protein
MLKSHFAGKEMRAYLQQKYYGAEMGHKIQGGIVRGGSIFGATSYMTITGPANN